MTSELKEILSIRYTKITFTIQFLEYTVMPEQKASALRGGIGEMLLRANCVRDRKCETCDFEKECIVQRTMYSKFDVKPEFITTGDSVGYVMECEDYRTDFEAGDQMMFTLLLFGKTIVYFNQYLQAIFALGQMGVGKYNSQFQIVRITNHRNRDILSENDIYMKNYEITTIGDYVLYRKHFFEEKGFAGKMIFPTPLTLKYYGKFLEQFDMDAILRGICRRLFMLDCFEGLDVEQMKVDVDKIPTILEQNVDFSGVKRYSNRQNMSMTLRGIKGSCILENVNEEILELLIAGELIHIGKNTSFGFGKYILK